jgi:outer membrane protein TolC
MLPACTVASEEAATIATRSAASLAELSLLEAIRTTVVSNAQLKTGAVVVEIAEQGIEVEEGAFDTVITASVSASGTENPLPISATQVISVDNSAQVVSAGMQRRLKSSAVFDFSLSSSTSGDESMGVSANQVGSTTAALTVTYPLWRGRGEYLTTLRLELAKLEFESTNNDLGHQIDLSILTTVRNYWEYRGASERLALLRQSEERSKALLSQITKLVAADELTRAELGVIEAQVSQRTGSRLAGEQSLIQNQASLASSLGVYLTTGTESHQPVTELPDPDLNETTLVSLTGDKLLSYILRNRKDFAALDGRIEIADRTVELADDATKPTLNLVVGGQYRTYEQDDGFLNNIGAPTFGPDWSVQLNYNWSLNQVSAKANQRIAILGTERRKIERNELLRAAEVDFNAASFSLLQAFRRYEEAVERLALSEKNVQNEKRKFLLDESTLLDVLNVEDQLLQAEVDAISQRVGYATSLANVMFLSGYLSHLGNDAIREADLKRADLFVSELNRSLTANP